MSKEEAKREIARLVERLKGLSPSDFRRYDEENTKKDFILPMFRALGWATEDRQEVTAEDKVSRRRVDYAFRIGGIPKFFLEAKKLKADLDDPQFAWQAISYAWTKGVTWAVLTDFEGLRIYNAEFIGPSLQHNIFISISYQEYLTRFDQLWLLSREACQESILDAEAEKVGKKFKRQPVDKELFEKLIEWRQMMHRQLRQYNKKYSSREIDEAVQRILDRLIFVRTAEDRELEPPTLIASVREWRENGHRKDLDVALKSTFREFDQKYDSELFEPHFSEDLTYDSTSYAQIIEGLYGMRDEVPSYLFDALDADVMGGIYEQYLSFTQGEVELEEKRARRKKMGIYYTPQFVVKYIVENTVGRLLKEKSHEEIRNLRILDPACGSGSFLIEAFDRLDRYHQEARGTARKNDPDAQYRDYMERVRILKENIYGVDLDPQAVEIARLNLLLKTLHQREKLPKLENNIRSGNSLISGLPVELSQYFGADYEAKRPFNWEEEEFSKVMKEGGFDVVIGNPPYVRFLELPEPERHYYRSHYQSAYKQFDIYVLFIERGLSLLRPGGRLGFITSSKFFASDYGHALRQYILDKCCVEVVADLSMLPVFKDAAIYPYVFVLRKEPDKEARDENIVRIISQVDAEDKFIGQKFRTTSLSQSRWRESPGLVFDIAPDSGGLLEKIEANSTQLGGICLITRGFRPPPRSLVVSQKEFSKLGPLAHKRLKRFVRGKGSVGRYTLNWDRTYLRYKPDDIPESKPAAVFDRPKIMIMDIGARPEAYYDPDSFYCLKTIYLILAGDKLEYDLRYISGILNSRLMDFYFRSRFFAMHMRGGYMRFRKQFLKLLPIRRIDFANPKDVKLHDRMVELVERMLELHKGLKGAVGEEKKDRERQIERTDRQIDDLVYELYGITEEERKIIEGKM